MKIENVFHLFLHFHVVQTHFHIKSFARRPVLKQRQMGIFVPLKLNWRPSFFKMAGMCDGWPFVLMFNFLSSKDASTDSNIIQIFSRSVNCHLTVIFNRKQKRRKQRPLMTWQWLLVFFFVVRFFREKHQSLLVRSQQSRDARGPSRALCFLC